MSMMKKLIKRAPMLLMATAMFLLGACSTGNQLRGKMMSQSRAPALGNSANTSVNTSMTVGIR